MTRPIAIFYHCLFFLDTKDHYLPCAFDIADMQMDQLHDSGLMDAASEMVVGINGGEESMEPAKLLFPPHARLVFHGLESHTENYTIRELEKWVTTHTDWLVCYFHCKGATRPKGDPLRTKWRECMMRNLVTEWRKCAADLENGYDAVGCHWMTGEDTPPGQSIFAGNFWWARADYLATIPSIMTRDRIQKSGLGNVESRYESEVYIGNGLRFPRVKNYHDGWVDTCK